MAAGGSQRFDAIVVGGRCAGSPLAALLARAGLSVCVVDRARFPSDTASTHGIQPAGVRILDQLGVKERLLELTPALERGTLAFDDARVDVGDLTDMVGAPMLAPRRIVLDAVLLEAAAAAGADVRTETAVTGLLEERGRIAGVETKSGPLRARLVVGADGVNSAVARLVGAEKYDETLPGRLFTWTYFEGADVDQSRMWLGAIGDHGFLGLPSDDGLFMAAAVPSIGRKAEVLSDRKAAFFAELAHWPELQAALEGGQCRGPIRVMARGGFFRRSAGPGWVLVGDAGHFKDPSPGQGISDALRQAVALAPAIQRALDGAGDGALHDWWRWRDRDAWEMYWFAHDMGAAGPPPRLVARIQSRIGGDPKLTDGMVRVLNHELPPSKVFTPLLAAKAALAELRARPKERGDLLREVRTIAANNWRRRAPSAPSPAAHRRPLRELWAAAEVPDRASAAVRALRERTRRQGAVRG